MNTTTLCATALLEALTKNPLDGPLMGRYVCFACLIRPPPRSLLGPLPRYLRILPSASRSWPTGQREVKWFQRAFASVVKLTYNFLLPLPLCLPFLEATRTSTDQS